MYAFAMVVYEVLTGTKPFGAHKVVELPMLTLQGSRPPRPEDPVGIGFGQGTWEFVEKCWDKDPKQRPTVREAQEHFERVAETSTVVDPGPTIPVHEPVNPRQEGSSRNLCESHESTQCLGVRSDNFPAKLFVPPSTNTRGRFQRTAYASRVLMSNRAVPVPTPHIGEPNLFGRIFRRLSSPRPTARLEDSPQDGT